MKKSTYTQQVYEAHMKAFNKARKLYNAESKQKPFETIHASDNMVHAKICVN